MCVSILIGQRNEVKLGQPAQKPEILIAAFLEKDDCPLSKELFYSFVITNIRVLGICVAPFFAKSGPAEVINQNIHT